jgi:radical SAM protein with 4Fe4S-binding SPASM domain
MKKINRVVNVAKAIRAYNKKQTKLHYYPLSLWIEPTNVCTLKCVMCPSRMIPKDETGFMSLETFKGIVDQTKEYVSDFYLFLGGESLLNKDIFEMIKYAKKRKIRCILHTNATILTKEKSLQLIDSGIDYVSFSFDGYDKETYESIRIGGNYEKVMENIISFLKIKKTMRVTKPYIVLQTLVISKKNFQNDEKAKKFYDLFKGLPIDEINVKTPISWGSILEDEKEIDFQNKKEFTPCPVLWNAMSIKWDGTVVPCCIDIFGEYKLGNIKEKSLKQIWNDEPLQRLRRSMLDGTYLEVKKGCKGCHKLWGGKVFGLPPDFRGMVGRTSSDLFGFKIERNLKKLAKKVTPNFQYEIQK